MSVRRNYKSIGALANGITNVFVGPLTSGDWLESIWIIPHSPPTALAIQMYLGMGGQPIAQTTLANWSASVQQFFMNDTSLAIQLPNTSVPYEIPLWHKVELTAQFISILFSVQIGGGIPLTVGARLRPNWRVTS